MLLAGDIGGTKTNLAVFSEERGVRELVAQKIFPSGQYPSLEVIVQEFLGTVDVPIERASVWPARWSTDTPRLIICPG